MDGAQEISEISYKCHAFNANKNSYCFRGHNTCHDLGNDGYGIKVCHFEQHMFINIVIEFSHLIRVQNINNCGNLILAHYWTHRNAYDGFMDFFGNGKSVLVEQ